MRCSAAGLAILAVALSTPASADDASLRAADAAYTRGALREAERLYEAALAEPGNGRDDLVVIHVHLGILAAAHGAERTARTHFTIALALDPHLPAPSELAGRDRSRFEQERPREGLALEAHVERAAEGVAAEGVEVVGHIEHAPAGLVHHLELRCQGASAAVAPVGRDGRARLHTARCEGPTIVARESHGGVLAEAAVSEGAP
ncbi:MAG: hypothetical protein U0353_20430 [Sandaracinus sp.]